MKKAKAVLSISFVLLTVAACSSSSDGDKNNAQKTTNVYVGSYEAADGCSTGRQIFTSDSEAGITRVFCEGLKDESLNKSCAIDQRAQIFEHIQCEGEFPVDKSSFVMTMTSQYAFSVNECGTGVHVFAASKESVLKEMLCRALKDDKLNNNCAKEERQEKYNEENCDKIVKSKPGLTLQDSEEEPQQSVEE